MIVLKLETDNLFGFEDFKINFSYPKKVENSSIKDEFLVASYLDLIYDLEEA